jgi:hypothetical protein
MLPEIDIWRAANLMLERYGENAEIESATRGDELAAEGDLDGAAVWRRITARPIRPVRGFKSMKTAYATIKGFEVMRALRKGQAAIFNLTRDIVGEARLVERAFGLGPCALTEAVQLVGQRLEAA